MFGGNRELCWVCAKSIYPNDPQWNFNGKLHKHCAKCNDCSCTLSIATMHSNKDSEGKAIIVCATHNASRGKAYRSNPAVSNCASIMSEAMEKALAQPSPRKGANVKATAADIDASSQVPAAPASEAALEAAAASTPSPPVPPAEAAAASASSHSLGHLVEDLQDGDEGTQLRTFWEISNLAKEDGSLEKLAAPELGLLATLAKIVATSASTESKAAAAGVLWNLSVSHENRIEIINPETALLPSLAQVIVSDHEDTAHRCLGVLHNTSLSAEAQPSFGAEPTLLSNLATLMLGANERLADQAAGVLWNISTCEANRGPLAKHSSMLASLVQALQRGRTDASDVPGKALIVVYYLTLLSENRPLLGATAGLYEALLSSMDVDEEFIVKVCGIFVNLSSASENKADMGAPAVGLLAKLVGLLADASSPVDLKSKICGCLWNLSVFAGNRSTMAEPELGLVVTIVHILGVPELEEMREVILKCCVIVQNLAGAQEAHPGLLSVEGGGLARSLLKQMLVGSADARMKAFGAIVNLSLTQASQTVLGASEGCFRAMKLMLADESMGDNRARACGVLHNLSVNADFRILIAREPGLLDLLMRLVTEGGPLRKNALGLTLNLCTAAENKPLVGEAKGLVDAAIACMSPSSPAEDQARGASLIWSLCSDAIVKQNLTADNNLIVALTSAAGRGGDVGQKAMGALSNLAPKVKVNAA